MSNFLDHFEDYKSFVHSRTKKLATPALNLVHMALGISGEAGEFVDAIKKHFIYGKPLDTVNVYEELGDLLFYIQGTLNALDQGWTLEDLIIENTRKLTRRYPERYSDAEALARKDKVKE